jgi:hypothetical protein
MDWSNLVYLGLGYFNIYVDLKKLGEIDISRALYYSYDSRWAGGYLGLEVGGRMMN